MKRTQNFKYYLAGAVSLITFIVYLASLHNEFVEWDDSIYVYGNPYIRSFNIAFFRWAFLDFYEGYWIPLTWISHALDYAVWGLNPFGHHLTNNILHALNTFLVVFLVMRLIEVVNTPLNPPLPRGDMGGGLSAFLNDQTIVIAGGVTGLLFGLHPLHVESVAWVAERKDLLCALFFLLSMMMYTKYAVLTDANTLVTKAACPVIPEPRFLSSHYLFTLGFFTLALMSKPMAVSLPFVLLILDWHPFKRIQSLRTFGTVFAEKLPFIALGIISSVFTVLAQRAVGAIVAIEDIPLSTRMLVAAKSLVDYLWKMILPLNLIPFYPYPQNVSPLSLEYLLAIAFVIGITLTCAVIVKKQKLWLSVWGYYVVTLIPVLGIVKAGLQSMADRFTYLPSLGPFFIMGLVVAWVSERVTTLTQRRLIVKLVCIITAILAFASMSYLTFEQVHVWKNSVSLWSYVVENEPEKSFIAYNNLGSALEKIGRYDKAIAYLNVAIALDPNGYLAYNNRGALFEKLGLFDKAIENFDTAITLNPNYYMAYYNRGITFYQMGQYSRAWEDINSAIELNKNFAAAYFARGNFCLRAGNKGLAVSDFQKACELGDNLGCNALQSREKMSIPDK